MIVVKLQGGLGNQMFQYASAAGIAKNEKVYLDLSFLKKHSQPTDTFTPRSFELDIFPNLNLKYFSPLKSGLIAGDGRINRILSRLLLPPLKVITDDTFVSSAMQVTDNKPAVYLDGYFQNENYFKHIRPEILRSFTFPKLQQTGSAWATKILTCKNSVSVHVRRGDYLKPLVTAFHGILTVEYYQKAKSRIEENIKSPAYFIFSDDPEWCKANLSFFGDKVSFVTNNLDNSWQDMCLMSYCKHHVIANSSYSWWGAWLNKNEDKVVIAPRKWFINQRADIIPKDWISI